MTRTLIAAVSTTVAMLFVAVVLVGAIGQADMGMAATLLGYAAIIVGGPFAWHRLYIMLSGDR